jgi:plastocyanin
MIRRATVAGLLIAVVTTGTAMAADRTVGATQTDTFSPTTTTVALNDRVRWSNTSTSRPHTSSSDLFNLWSYDISNPGSTSPFFQFQHAGRYAYHCDIHGSMTGSVKVKLSYTRSGSTYTIRVARINAPTGFKHELQRKNPGSSTFGAQTSTSNQTVSVNLTQPGTYRFRARYRKTGGVATGFSPVLSITVN